MPIIKEIKKPDAFLQKLLPPQKPEAGVVYRPSQFVRQSGGRVWNTLTQQCLETDLPGAVRAGEGYDGLIRSFFLVPEGKDECRFYMSLLTLARTLQIRPGYHGYTILPTTRCNARCVYCYEQGMLQTTMTPDIIRQTVRFIKETHADETVRLGWFGGEPLLCPEIIDAVCGGLAEAGIAFKSSMITNGSLITQELIRRRMAGPWNLRKIQLSMDSDEADYIRRKRYPLNQDQYHTVLNAAGMLADAGIRVTIRCNVDRDNWDGLNAFFTDLKAAVRDRSRVGVYLCPLDEVRTGPDDIAMWQRVMAANDALGQEGFAYAQSLCGNGHFHATHCMADMNRVAICPDGSLYACERCPQAARFGDIRNNVTLPDARRAFCRMDRPREKCRSCPYLPICTPFAACPVQDTHCREIRDLALPAFLRRLSEADMPDDDDA